MIVGLTYRELKMIDTRQYPASSFANARQKINTEKDELEKHYNFHKGTTYSIGKPSEPHDLLTLQRNDFNQKQNDNKVIAERGN